MHSVTLKTLLSVILAVCLGCGIMSAGTRDGALRLHEGENAGRYIKGIVRDSLSGEPLPRVSVFNGSKTRSAVSDLSGIFEILLPEGDSIIRVSSMGYEPREIIIKPSRVNLAVVYLTPSTTGLDELVVTKKKYSKKNNPAVEFAKRLRHSGRRTDPRANNQWYSYDRYDRTTLAVNKLSADTNAFLFSHLPFLKEYLDTSDISGTLMINLSVREKLTSVVNRRDPRSCKNIVRGRRSVGIEQVGNVDNIRIFIDDVMREIDLYDNDINLLQNRFVSPLSPIAPDFYKFYLTDTVVIDGRRCVVLSFYPFNRSSFGFNGHVYVRDDTTMNIMRVDLSLPPESNVNFVDKLFISQTFDVAPDGSRLKLTDNLTMEMTAIPGLPGLYARRVTSCAGHSFAEPDSAGMQLFETMRNDFESDSAAVRTDEFWEEPRLQPVTRQEQRVGSMLREMGKSKFFYYTSRAINMLTVGYVGIGKKFDYGPLNTTVSFNDIEGTRFRVGGMTTSALSKRWFARGFVAWGTKDHKWKYRIEGEYSFIDKKLHSREFPVRSLRLTQGFDIDYVGQNYLFTNADNIFLSLKRMKDRNVIYRHTTDLTYTLELDNNFSVKASLRRERREATREVPFVDGFGDTFGHFDENMVSVTLRYAPGEKFYQSRSNRYPVNLDAPVIQLTHTFAPKGFMGSRYEINKTELSMQKRFWVSAFGYLDAMLKGGHVWSRSPYLDLMIPNANLSYTIQPESFALLNPLEFVGDSQLSWFLTYNANGALFNLVPGLRKLKLRECFMFNGFFGHLSKRNRPEFNPSLPRFAPEATTRPMDDGAYLEAAVGIDNILSCLRVDYVWRLRYCNTPYEIDRSGLRIAFHMAF